MFGNLCIFAVLINSGPVVQLNRTSDSGSEGRGFESLLGHATRKKGCKHVCSLFASKPSQARLAGAGCKKQRGANALPAAFFSWAVLDPKGRPNAVKAIPPGPGFAEACLGPRGKAERSGAKRRQSLYSVLYHSEVFPKNLIPATNPLNFNKSSFSSRAKQSYVLPEAGSYMVPSFHSSFLAL